MAYARTTTVDSAQAGDTILQSVVDCDTDITGIYTHLNTHEALTATHGATGAIVGTTNTQTLTNKTLSSPTLTGTVTATGATLVSPTITGTGAIAGVFTGNLTGNVTGDVTGTCSIYAGIPAGTKMVFYQDVAPTGWTIANTLDDKVLYITKGSAAGGQTGGGAHSTGSWTHTSHTHTGPSHTHTGPSHTHTLSAHTHSVSIENISLDTGSASVWVVSGAGTTSVPSSDATSAAGTGATGAEGTGATGASATANTWRPAAYCAIIATKD